MKFMRVTLLLLALGLSVFGQGVTVTASAIKVETVSGTCRAGQVRVTAAGVIYSCQSGTWGAAGGSASDGANAALSNLASVSINASLIPQTTLNLGAQATAWKELWLYGSGTFGSHSFKLTGTPTGHRIVTFPDASITVARTDAAQTFSGIQTVESARIVASTAVSALGNLFFGASAGAIGASGSHNVGIGTGSFTALTSGNYNVGIGWLTGGSTNTGGDNVFVGRQSGHNHQSGSNNLYVGSVAGYFNISGSDNVGVGAASLYSTTASGNVGIGSSAGRANTTGTNNTFIGNQAGYTGTSTGLTNATAIGYNAQVAQSNSLILGASALVGINNTAPGAQLHTTVGASGTIGQIIRLASGQTAPALNIENSTGTLLSGVLASGAFYSAGIAFASLGTPANGTFVYCTDCTIASPCAGSGTGALAKRLNGAWVCN